MAVVIAFLMCAFFFLAFFSIYCRECLDSRAAEARTIGPTNRCRHNGLDKAVIETFPILVYSAVKELKMGKGALECAVCLSEFEEYETLRLLPKCSHVFHPDCIDPWLASRSTCSVCKAKLTPVDQLAPKVAQSTTEWIQQNSASENGAGEHDDVLINVEDDDYPTRVRISGKFPRSHSTDGSLTGSTGREHGEVHSEIAEGGEEADHRDEWEVEAVE
jgi:E3 ubiquitin-protein ligase ATL6/9/15/31/42/55